MFRPARQMKFNFLESSGETILAGADDSMSLVGFRGENKELTARCQDLVRLLELDDLRDRLRVEWNPRMRSCAGRAFWPHGLIQLNPRLASISDAEVKRTALHELAHLIAYERHPYRAIKSHGKEWRKACADVGIPGEKATHELALPTRSHRRQWRYECPHCQKSFERVRRYKSAVACYDCCRKATGGAYDASLQLTEVRLSR